MSATSFFWLIPLLPLGVFAILSIGLMRFGKLAATLAITALAGSAALALFALVAASQGARARVAAPWLTVGGRDLTLALGLDPLSGVVATVVAIVGLVVFSYAATYMRDDPAYGRFFATMSLFIGGMLTLVMAADLITLFIAWELVGLCSYLLIGFWRRRPAAPPAATKAFATTRLADLAFLLAVMALISAVGSSRIDALLGAVAAGRIPATTLTVVAVLLAVGAAGKSAQFPFQGWLADAMAGPTPVSALLHSATMVVAGVFLIARLYPIFQAVPLSLTLIAWAGAITALLGATAALTQTDLKRLLAYSTMSQIGLMFVGLGAGSVVAGITLLVAQAFYKCTLFLAAGAVDHAVGGTGFARMGGLARRMPVTMIAFLIAAAALAGLPITLAFPAKDAVLAAAAGHGSDLFIVALVASVFTALYSARAFGLVFLGPPAPPARDAREALPGMRIPLVALVILLFLILTANSPLFGAPLGRILHEQIPDSGMVTFLALGSAIFGVAGGLAARALWPSRIIWSILRPLAPLLDSEYGLRPLYRGLSRALLAFGNLLGWFDRHTFDAFAGGAARATLALVRGVGRFDLRAVDGAFNSMATALSASSQRLRRIQTGMLGNYLLAIMLWGLGAAVVAVVALLAR